jgi:predicted nucleotide-binding protein
MADRAANMREEEELQALKDLQVVWDDLRSLVQTCAGANAVTEADEQKYRELTAKAQHLYGRTSHLMGTVVWTSFGRSVKACPHVLGQPSVTSIFHPLPTFMFWENSWGGSASEIAQAIGRQEERIARLKERRAGVQAAEGSTQPPAKVFIVHGHDMAILNEVARFLTELDIEPIILMEQAHRGRTLMEKLEQHSDVAYAVILCTADDVGRGIDEDDLKPRARQNVVLELGYFIGRLSRAGVCVLMTEGLDMPTDVHGVGYLPIEPKGAWQLTLAKEMKAAGLPIDLNKLG